jgi:modulator of FtsH protease
MSSNFEAFKSQKSGINLNQGTLSRDEQRDSSFERMDIQTFVKQTYQLFAGSLLAGSVGAYLGMGVAGSIKSWYWGLVILEFALLFGLYFTKNKPGINLAMLFGFTFVSGLTIVPLLSSILALSGGGAIVTNAFLLTGVIFGGLSIYAMNTRTAFVGMGKGLLIALVIVLIGSIINIFLGSPILQILISGAVVMLFSAFILYDTQNIINGAYETPVEGAVALYLDFFNIFVALLQIFGILSSDD